MSQTLSGVGYTHFRFHRWAVERYFAALDQLPEEKLIADSGLSFGSIYKTLLHVAQRTAYGPAGLPATPPCRLLTPAWPR